MPMMTQTASLGESRSDRRLVSCAGCHFLRDCGGLDGQQGLWGCFSKCKSDGVCNRADWTCPCRPERFARRLEEVRGDLHPFVTRFLTAPLNDELLPIYVPLIHHGYARRIPFKGTFVALPTFNVIAKRQEAHTDRQ